MSKFDKGYLTGAITITILKYAIRIALMAGYVYVFNQLGLYANDFIMKIMATLTAAGLGNFVMGRITDGYIADPVDDIGRIKKLVNDMRTK